MIILLSEEKGDSRSLLSHDRLYQREVFSIATIFCSILGPNFKHCCFKVIIILLSEEKVIQGLFYLTIGYIRQKCSVSQLFSVEYLVQTSSTVVLKLQTIPF